MARAPLVLAGLLGHGFLLPCEGITGLAAAGHESAGRESAERASMEELNPRDVWKKLTMVEQPAEQCGDAQPGDKCHQLVTWSLEKGLTEHPDWFVTYKKSVYKDRNFKAIQEILYSRGKAGCLKPCPTIIRTKAQIHAAELLAQAEKAAKAAKEAEEKAEEEAQAEAQARIEAEERAREAREARTEAARKAKQEAKDLAEDAAAQTQKVAKRQADIDKVEAELAALNGISSVNAPSLKALKDEKKQHLERLQAHLRDETNKEAAAKEASVKATKAAAELLRKNAEAETQAQKDAEMAKQQAAEKATKDAEELARKEAEAEAQAQQEADKQERSLAQKRPPALEDMSPEKLKEYMDKPKEMERYVNHLTKK